MVIGDYCYYNRYADGSEIMVGDHVSWLSNNVDKPHLGVIVAVLAPNTEEARNWGMPNGGYLVEMEDIGLTGSAVADEEMSLIRRGSEQDITWANDFLKHPVVSGYV